MKRLLFLALAGLTLHQAFGQGTVGFNRTSRNTAPTDLNIRAASIQVSGSDAGHISLGEGTAPSAPADSIVVTAPAAVDSAGWQLTLPGSPGTGFLYGENTAGLVAVTFRTIQAGDLPSTQATDSEVAVAISALSSVYQALNAQLTAIGALTTTTYGRSLLTLADASAGRTSLGVVPGTDVQAYDADLAAVAAESTTGIRVRTGSGTTALRAITGTSGRVTVSQGDGVSGNPTLTLPDSAVTRHIPIKWDGGGSSPTANTVAYWVAPVAGTISKITLISDVSGTAVVDVWKDTGANYPPTNADSMVDDNGGSGTKPTLTAANRIVISTFTGWATLQFNAGDILAFNLDSSSTLTVLQGFVEWLPQ